MRTILDLRWPEEAARHPSPVPERLPQLRYARISLLTYTEDEWRLRARDAAKELWKCVVLEHHTLPQLLGGIARPQPPFIFRVGQQRDARVTQLRQALGHRARMACCLLRPAQIEDGAHAVVGERLQAELTQLREIICAQQRSPARVSAVGRRIAAQVAGIQQLRKGQRPSRLAGRRVRFVPQVCLSRRVSRC